MKHLPVSTNKQIDYGVTAKFISIGPLDFHTHISGSLMRGIRPSGWWRGVAYGK